MFLWGIICTNPFNTASFDRVFTSSQGINKLEWLLSKQSFWSILLHHRRLRRENKIIGFTVTIDGDQFNYLESSKWGFALFAYIYCKVCLPSEVWKTLQFETWKDLVYFAILWISTISVFVTINYHSKISFNWQVFLIYFVTLQLAF